MLLYTGRDISTLQDCYQEARLLAEALARLGLGFPLGPRKPGTVKFNYRDDGSLESVFVQAETHPPKG